jgi:hypothetical protein
MIRTQVYLPTGLHRQIRLRAQRERKPAAQVIREALEQGLRAVKPRQTAGEGLLGLPRLGIKGPKGLSQNIDKYLYEE